MLLPPDVAVFFELAEVVVDGSTGDFDNVANFARCIWFSWLHDLKYFILWRSRPSMHFPVA